MILRFAAELSVLRTPVNAPCSTGASGFATNLAPTMTVGTGFFGRSSVGDNVGPQHLVQWSKVAYCKDVSVDIDAFESIHVNSTPLIKPASDTIDYSFSDGFECNSPTVTSPADASVSSEDLRAEIHKIILEEIRSLQLVQETRY